MIEINLFDYLKKISNTFANMVWKKLQESSIFEIWMLTRLKFVTLVVIESMLEGNSDHFILKKILKSINSQCLKTNLYIVYYKYSIHTKEQYTMEVFNHADLDIRMLYDKKK